MKNTFILWFAFVFNVLFVPILQAQDDMRSELGKYLDKKKSEKQSFVDQKKKEDSLLSAFLTREKALLDSIERIRKQQTEALQKIETEKQKAEQKTTEVAQTLDRVLNGDPMLPPPVKDDIDTVFYKDRIVHLREYNSALGVNPEPFWDKYRNLSENNTYKKHHALDSGTKVFGWHPYWMGSAYKAYNFSLLSAVAYFSYEMEPTTGSYKTIHQWRTTNLVDSAKKYGTKVLLSVTNFGGANNAAFLTNVKAQRRFIDTIKVLLKDRNADGINIDFEGVQKRYRHELTNFIIDLSTQLRQVRKDYYLTLAVPAVDLDTIYDIKQLNKHIDLYVVMGYEFYGAGSKVAGPVAPIRSGELWWKYDLEHAVSYYLNQGTPPSKLLMGLPYYGSEWMTRDLTIPADVRSFVDYRMYRTIRATHGKLSCCVDEASMSKTYGYRADDDTYRQIWYEDEESLAKKYDWVKSKKIGGIGIWALGYDNGYSELWKLLATKFAVSAPESKKSTQFKITRSGFSRLFTVLRYPTNMMRNPFVFLGLFGSIFGLQMGGLYMLRRYGCSYSRLTNVSMQGVIAFLIILLVALVLFSFKYVNLREIIVLVVGFAIAALLFFLFGRQFLSEKELP